MKKDLIKSGTVILDLCILIIGWHILTYYNIIPWYILPAPSAIVRELTSNINNYWEQILFTAMPVIYGYILGIIFGLLCAIAMVYSDFARRLLYPLIVISQTIPHIAIAPLLLFWFGYGIFPRILIVIQFTFFPIALDMVQGLTNLDSELLDFMVILKASKFQVFKNIRLPNSLPFFFTALKTTAPYAVMGALISEWIGSPKGLGMLLLQANRTLMVEVVFSCVIIIMLGSFILFLMAFLAEYIIIPWHHKKLSKYQ